MPFFAQKDAPEALQGHRGDVAKFIGLTSFGPPDHDVEKKGPECGHPKPPGYLDAQGRRL